MYDIYEIICNCPETITPEQAQEVIAALNGLLEQANSVMPWMVVGFGLITGILLVMAFLRGLNNFD